MDLPPPPVSVPIIQTDPWLEFSANVNNFFFDETDEDETGCVQKFIEAITAAPPPKKTGTSKGWWKTELCKFWREGNPGCRNGNTCRWAHGIHDLRSSHSSLDTKKWSTLTNIKPHIIHMMWNHLRLKFSHLNTLRENLIVAIQPGIHSENSEYWQALIHSVAANTQACPACYVSKPEQQNQIIPTCEQCKIIAKGKTLNLNFFGNNSQNSTLINWALKIAHLLRICHDSTWNLDKSPIDILKTQTDNSKAHFALATRLTLVVNSAPSYNPFQIYYHLESLPPSHQSTFRTAIVENLSISILEWLSIADQPLVFLALILNNFPLPQQSLPPKVLALANPLAPANPLALAKPFAPANPLAHGNLNTHLDV